MTRLLLLLSLAFSLHAQFSWRGFSGPGYVYFGFDGSGPPADPTSTAGQPNIFTTATGTDGITWKNAGGSWSDYLSGSPLSGTLYPYQINAPDCLVINSTLTCHVASAGDSNQSTVTWIIGQANAATGAVSTIASINWVGAISGVQVCFAGGWVRNSDSSVYVDGSGFVHLYVPCSTSGQNAFKMYETHSLATDLVSWSAPSAVTVTSLTNVYDPQVYLIGSTFYMWFKDAAGKFIDLASSSTLAGAYTLVYSGNWAGWGSGFEGVFAYPQVGGTGWFLIFEAYTTTHQMYYSTCSTNDFTACTWTSKLPWSEDALYRHGSVLYLP
jgi:hypothetical protein